MKKIYLSISIILVTGLVFSTLSCMLYGAIAFRHELEGVLDSADSQNIGADPKELVSSDDEITIAWDEPPSAVESYKVLFRFHDTQDWYLINQILAVEDPDYTMFKIDFDDGPYDFGVKAVDSESEESLLHFSLETTADPDTGWYLIWLD